MPRKGLQCKSFLRGNEQKDWNGKPDSDDAAPRLVKWNAALVVRPN